MTLNATTERTAVLGEEGEAGRSTRTLRLLVMTPEPAVFRDLARHAEQFGAVLEKAPDQASALQLLTTGGWDALLTTTGDDPEYDLDGWRDLLDRLPVRPRLMGLVPAPSMDLMLRAAQAGGIEVLTLPVNRDQFRGALQRLTLALEETPLTLPETRPVVIGPYQLVSQSPTMLEVYRTIAHVVPSTATVLILGDSGTGKELVARAVHLNGPRAGAPFVAVNCAAIPENLLESELFGHEKGAFTGAIASKIGRFERASGGTLFLDEIADMSLVLQSKILRAVQEREIERVGGTGSIPVDVRLIAATNRDLPSLIAAGQFREDLYYRLAVMMIHLPRLAERGDDLLLLTAHFLRQFGTQYAKRFTAISDRALALLKAHEWVGNVRELRNVIERAVLMAEGEILRAEHLPNEWRTGPEAAVAAHDNPLATLQEVEARHIAQVLARTHGQIGEAALILGIHRNTLARKVKEYQL